LVGAAGAGALTLAAPALPTMGAFASTTAQAGMPPLSEIWDWQQQLVSFGTRYTANPRCCDDQLNSPSATGRRVAFVLAGRFSL
jgi:hypothetical protein